jgi:hypothetical protein
VDAALQKLAMPALGHWRDVAREALLFLGKGMDARSWAGEVHAFARARFGGSESCRALEVIAQLAGCPRTVEKDPLEFLELLPAYRNAMSSAHGGIKSDTETYEQGAWALLELVKSVHSGGGLLGGARLELAEEVLFDASGEIKMMSLDLSGPSAIRRLEYEEGDIGNGILPGRLYVETRAGGRISLHPFLFLRSTGILDDVLFLNRARDGARGIQFLCYTTGELHVPSAEHGEEAIALGVTEFLEWTRSVTPCEEETRLISFPGPHADGVVSQGLARVDGGPAA